MNPIILGAIIVLVVIGVIYFLKGSGGRRELRQEALLYRRLLSKSFGDRAQVERLIELERQRNPQADQLTLLKNAIARWERDSR